MPTKTNKTTADILKFLFKKGIFAWRQNSTGIFDTKKAIFRPSSKKGVSDIIAIVPPTGKFLGIEIKIGSDRIRPEQQGFMESVHHVGGCYMVVKSFDDFVEQFKFSELIAEEDYVIT